MNIQISHSIFPILLGCKLVHSTSILTLKERDINTYNDKENQPINKETMKTDIFNITNVNYLLSYFCRGKGQVFLLLLLLFPLTFSSCFEDETTLGNRPISEITIDSTSIQQVYNINKNDTLIISPIITQTTRNKALSYTWEIELKPYSHDANFLYIGKELGSYNCRLIVENSDGKSFFPFILHVNSPYEEGLTIISKDKQGNSMLSFMLTPTDGSEPTGFMTGDQFKINNADIAFSANPADIVQSSGSLILACQGSDDGTSPATIYYLNEKTFVVENMLTAPEYPDFKPTYMSIPSVGATGVAYPVLCENGHIYEFSTTEGALAKPVKLPYTYAQTAITYDEGKYGYYNLIYWDKEINALSLIYNGYGPYYCGKDYLQKRENCTGTSNFFNNLSIRKMTLVRLTEEQRKAGMTPNILVITNNQIGFYQKSLISVHFWEYNYETTENVLVDNGGYKVCGMGELSLTETTPCVANSTYYSMLFADGNNIRRWNYTTSQNITAADILLTIGSESTIITSMELSADHKRTYVAFYDPNQEGLNGSVWVIDTDNGNILAQYNNVCYQPVKIMYKKK